MPYERSEEWEMKMILGVVGKRTESKLSEKNDKILERNQKMNFRIFRN